MKKLIIFISVLIFAACSSEPEVKLTPEEKRKQEVEAQFSNYDGSHAGLEELIKKGMNDADSYEHVETRFRDDGTYITVITKFKGTNKFGGIVTNTVTAKVDFKGKVIEVVSQN